VILTHQITPCLWFDNRIEEAVKFYISVFGGKIHDTSYYGEGAPQPKGTALTVTFRLKDQEFVALNGGPHFKFTEAISFYVRCETQAEVDDYWNKLTADGGQESQCSWLKDKYGLSWQIVPTALLTCITDKDPAKAQRTMAAMMTMKKIDSAAIEKAHAG
jgi:predicted 3-demethylubiquinone-9 3-methyltransferase (glyoxalase superfamily)